MVYMPDYDCTDVWDLTKAEIDGRYQAMLAIKAVLILPTTGRYQIPYGITVPQRVENLLVAGRCVAGDKMSHAAIRSMMCCTLTG